MTLDASVKLWAVIPCVFPLTNVSVFFFSPPTTDSENSLLRYLSDDKILVIQEEPLTQKDNKRDTGRRSRKKGKPTSSPNYPISPSVLTSTINVRLEPGQQDVLNFSLAENNTVPLYHVSTHQNILLPKVHHQNVFLLGLVQV